MGERVKVRFWKNYIATQGESNAGVQGAFKMYPATKQLQALIESGTLELEKEGEAEKREKATIAPPEVSGAATVKKKAKEKPASD